MAAIYPFDPTGTLASNRVTEEAHVVSDIQAQTYYIILPQAAPYYSDSMVVEHIDLSGTRTTLTKDVDYYETLIYLGATRSTGLPVYGGISLNNDRLNGVVVLSYQTVGGKWIADSDHILRVLANNYYNPKIATWDQVTNVQEIFPPTNHQLDIDNTLGHDDLIAAVNSLSEAIAIHGGNIQAIFELHTKLADNPHGVTKEQVGLGLVENLPLATPDDISRELAVDKYTTLAQSLELINRVRAVLSAQGTLAADHFINYSNPHRVTKAQVGLDKVENLPLATELEILSRAPVEKYITLRQYDLMMKKVEQYFENRLLTLESTYGTNITRLNEQVAELQAELQNIRNYLPYLPTRGVLNGLTARYYYLMGHATPYFDHDINVTNIVTPMQYYLTIHN